ncbi:MAG TPA: hypothetical protein VF173_33765 [Thermoanaerobaculia bacterium]|nr:hypothetical protein [Thermoanaerobaculia bacterium]
MSFPSDTADKDRPSPQEELAPAQGNPGVAEGEDDVLIHWMLSLTPLKRLEMAQGFMEGLIALRNGRRV